MHSIAVYPCMHGHIVIAIAIIWPIQLQRNKNIIEVQLSMESFRKLISAGSISFHLENCYVEKAIADQHHLLDKEIKYDKLKSFITDFYDNSRDNSLFYLFHDALDYANSHKEAYSDIKNILFEIIKLFERMSLHFNKIVISIQNVLVKYISFYMCLMQDSDYEQAAYSILGSVNDYQTVTIFDPLELIAEQPLSVKATIEDLVERYTLQEQFGTSYIKKFQLPISLMQNSLVELFNTKEYVISAYERLREAVKGRMMNTVKQTHSKSWENHEMKKLFLNTTAIY